MFVPIFVLRNTTFMPMFVASRCVPSQQADVFMINEVVLTFGAHKRQMAAASNRRGRLHYLS